MKFTIERNELVSKLQDIQGIAESNPSMPILGHALISIDNGSSSLMATNLTTSVMQQLKLISDDAGKFCIPAKKLLEIVRELDKPISFEKKDNWITIKSDKHKFKIACLPAEQYPTLPTFEEEITLTLKGDVFAGMLDRTEFAAPEKDQRVFLNSLLFHLKTNATITIVSTNGQRLSLIRKKLPIAVTEEKKYIVPKKSVQDLAKILDGKNDVTIRINKKTAVFETVEKTLVSQLLEGSYPDYEKVLPKDHDKVITVKKAELLKAIKLASIISGDSSVVIELSKNTITISAKQKELGETNSPIDIQYEGDALTLGVNAKYLMEALSVVESDDAILKFKEALYPVL